MVTGTLRIHVRRSRLEWQKRFLGSLSDIYYRIHYCDESYAGEHQLQTKLQCGFAFIFVMLTLSQLSINPR